MAKRSDRGSVKLVRCSDKPRAKSLCEISPDLANHHRGQRSGDLKPFCNKRPDISKQSIRHV